MPCPGKFSHGTVKVFDKSQDFGLEIGEGSERAAFEQFARENAKPNLDLVHPGSVLGGVVKDQAVGRVGQKGGATFHRSKNTRFAFDAQVEVEIGLIGDIAHERLGLVRVEIIDNEVPLHDAGVSFNGGADMSQEIRFVAGRARGELAHPSSGDVKIDNEGERAMPFVLELAAQDLSACHGQIGVLARQGERPSFHRYSRLPLLVRHGLGRFDTTH